MQLAYFAFDRQLSQARYQQAQGMGWLAQIVAGSGQEVRFHARGIFCKPGFFQEAGGGLCYLLFEFLPAPANQLVAFLAQPGCYGHHPKHGLHETANGIGIHREFKDGTQVQRHAE